MEKRKFLPEIPLHKIPGFLVGHAQDQEAATGCSVIVFPKGAVGGVDVRGGAPGTRETDLLRPENEMQIVHAVVLSGGSAYGLAAASGAMKFLEEQGIGFETGAAKVPIVCSAVLYDLAVGSSARRPDEAMGYAACKQAFLRNQELLSARYGENGPDQERCEKEGRARASQEPPMPAMRDSVCDEAGRCETKSAQEGKQEVRNATEEEIQGNIGAGTGASVGKILGMEYAMKGGLGIFAVQAGDLQIGAVMVVNAVGDVVDSATGEILAGLLGADKKSFLSTENLMIQQCIRDLDGEALAKQDFQEAGENSLWETTTRSQQRKPPLGQNTTIGILITNAKLTKAQANKVASMAQNGLARALRPAHTMFDGDTLFVMASGQVQADVSTVGMLGALVVERSIQKGVEMAESCYGLTGLKSTSGI